jgi:hypothetical protein
MGMYKLMEGKEVNGRGVWQMAEGQEYFIYYSSSKEWYIGGRASMEAGKAAGWVRVASTALTPDQVTETWQVADMVAKAWVDAPKARARMCSAEEKRAAAEKLEQERQSCMSMLCAVADRAAQAIQAMAAARQVRDIRMLDSI